MCWHWTQDKVPSIQLSNKPLHYCLVDDDISIALFCQQSRSAGISEVLADGKYDLTVCQRTEVLPTLFWGVADPLQNSPLLVQILQQVGSCELLSCKLCFP